MGSWQRMELGICALGGRRRHLLPRRGWEAAGCVGEGHEQAATATVTGQGVKAGPVCLRRSDQKCAQGDATSPSLRLPRAHQEREDTQTSRRTSPEDGSDRWNRPSEPRSPFPGVLG